MKCDGNFDESDFVGAVANNASVVIFSDSNDSGFDSRDVSWGAFTKSLPNCQAKVCVRAHVRVFGTFAHSLYLHRVEAEVVSRMCADVTNSDLAVAFGGEIALDKEVGTMTVANENRESLRNNSIKCLQGSIGQETDRARSRNKNDRFRHERVSVQRNHLVAGS